MTDTAPAHSTTKAPTSREFRGSMARLRHSLSTLRSAVHTAPRKTRFWLLAALPGGIGYPQGFYERFPRCFLHRFLLSQASWRRLCQRFRVPLGEVARRERTNERGAAFRLFRRPWESAITMNTGSPVWSVVLPRVVGCQLLQNREKGLTESRLGSSSLLAER